MSPLQKWTLREMLNRRLSERSPNGKGRDIPPNPCDLPVQDRWIYVDADHMRVWTDTCYVHQ